MALSIRTGGASRLPSRRSTHWKCADSSGIPSTVGVVQDVAWAGARCSERNSSVCATSAASGGQCRAGWAGTSPAPERSWAHLVWMLEYLHEHHTNEETGLFPVVRSRDPQAATLLDEMDDDHATVAGAAPALIDAAKAYAVEESALGQVRETLDALCDALLAHLRREEEELMPIVERTVTKAEWDAWEAGIVAALSKRQLAALGLWTLDGQQPEDVAYMAALVPPVPRWIILNVLVRGCRRRAFACWWDAEHSPWKLRPGGSVSVQTAASPEQVWALQADLDRLAAAAVERPAQQFC